MNPVNLIDQLPYELTNRILQTSGDDPQVNGSLFDNALEQLCLVCHMGATANPAPTGRYAVEAFPVELSLVLILTQMVVHLARYFGEL